VKLPKARQITHRSRTALLERVDYSVSAREMKRTGPGSGSTVPENVASNWNPNGVGKLNTGSPVYRNDTRLLDFEGTVEGGFTFTHEARGKGLSYKDINGNRVLKTEIYSFIDPDWTCISGGHVATSTVLPQGVTSRRSRDGEQTFTIKSATPDAFLGQLSLPQMSYILGKAAYDERFQAWYLATHGYKFNTTPPSPLPDTDALRRASIGNVLGYPLQGVDGDGMYYGNYKDPFGGFGNNDRDEYTMKAGQLMKPIPANDNHFLGALSPIHAFSEIICNHFRANGESLPLVVGMKVDLDASLEDKLLTFDLSGSFNSMAAEVARNGVWSYGWNSKSQFYMVPDFCTMGLKDIPLALVIVDGPSLIGDIEFGRATSSSRVSRVKVKIQPLLGFGNNETDVLTSSFDDLRVGLTYPIDTPDDGRVGSEIALDNYMGLHGQEQARRWWSKSNQQSIFNWNNFPYPELAMGLLGKAVALRAKDPKGAFDFTTGDNSFSRPELTYRTKLGSPVGKLFKCVRVKGTWQDNGLGGGAFMCSANFEEIIARGE
jgi:hypothetical protein